MGVSTPGSEERVLFSPNLPPPVNQALQQAVAAYGDTARAEQLLWRAQTADPDQLAVYTALYKFYFHKNLLDDAENVVHLALHRAAQLGGFVPDCNRLHAASADWWRGEGPECMYLYSLKALAFIRLRRHDADGAETVLIKLQELDPADQVGGAVIRELAAAMEANCDE